MTLDLLFNISMASCLVALLFAVLALIVRAPAMRYLTLAALGTTLVLLTVYTGMRWVEAGRPPFSNMFESVVLFAWAIIAVYLGLRIKIKARGLDAATALLALLGLAYASTYCDADIRPLMPALQSNWLTVHVFTCFLGYAGFAVSSLAAIGYLIATREQAKSVPASMLQAQVDPLAVVYEQAKASPEAVANLDAVMTKSISFGFLFLTLGIITGSVWANHAWGTYWAWDPKETWSLITWFVYAFFLHARYMRGWRGRKVAWVSIIGFAAVLFTYFGVNYLPMLSGLHSYA